MSPSPITAVPPLPPEIAAQAQQGPPAATPMFSQIGASMPNPLVVLKGKLAQLEQWASETAPLLSQVNPALATLLLPIAQAGKALQSEIEQIEQQTAGPSSQVMGSVAPNVPGNIPGAQPAQ